MKYKLLTIILCFALLSSCGSHYFDSKQASESKAQSFLNSNIESAELLYEYFLSLDCYSISIYLDEYKATVLYSYNGYKLSREDIEIKDKDLKRAIRSLYFAGAEAFHAEEHGFHITVWTSLADFGAGIVYNESDSEAQAGMQIQFLTKLKELEQKGYFYYESDYNKYREEHRN